MKDLKPEQAMLVAAFVKKLIGLGIKAEFSRIEEGPVLTTYFVKLDASIPISKIIRKAEDFALAANAEKVTITRIGGEIAIQVPNLNRNIIDFKDVLHWTLTNAKPVLQNLPIPLGVDQMGDKVSLDLTEMPH